MSSVLRPVGPRRAQIYWRRRVVAIALLTLLVVGILLLVRGCGGGGGAPLPSGSSGSMTSAPTTSAASSSGPSGSSESSSPAPTSDASSSVAPPSSASASASPSASPSESLTSAPPVLLRCEDAAILVEVITDGDVFPLGSDVPMELWVTNVSTTPCIRNLGTDVNRVVVRDGDRQIWSSTSCEWPKEPKDVTLMPASTNMIPLIWDGRSNYAGCTANEPMATAGDYQVSARNGEVTSRSVMFTLQ